MLGINRELKGKKRVEAHVIGEKAVSILEEIVPDNWVIREYNNPDYGIDLSVELFDENHITKGEHILFQVKGTKRLDIITRKVFSRKNVEKSYEKNNEEYIETEVIRYVIDVDLLATVERMGGAVPVLLSVVDINEKEAYFICLNDYIEKVLVPENPNFYSQEKVTVYIPIENKINTDIGKKIIEWYGKRAKLYAFFNKVNYQLKELEYHTNLDYVELTNHFLKILSRLDIWSETENLPIFQIQKQEIEYYLEKKITKNGEKILENALKNGEDIESPIYEATYCIGEVSYKEAILTQELHSLWEQLSLIGDIFEENYKESYLPTFFYLSMINS